MELENQESISKIKDCPLKSEGGEIKLYRCVKAPVGNESFVPYAITKPKLESNCIAWGLSTYKSLNTALQTLENLSKKKQDEYNAIAECIVKNEDGIKHQSLSEQTHYTFYPIKGFDFLNKFNIVENEK